MSSPYPTYIHRCTKRSATPPSSTRLRFDAGATPSECSPSKGLGTSIAAGLSYEDVHRSENRSGRHAVAGASGAGHSLFASEATPPNKDRLHAAKRQFDDSIHRPSEPRPDRVKVIDDRIFRESSAWFPTSSPSATDASSSSKSIGTSASGGPRTDRGKHVSRAFEEAHQRRAERDSRRLGVGNPAPAPHQSSSYRLVTPYARDDGN
eukprot:CAMPEP_0176415738 /NCGR_PEP_ID=MMETSP0127-20121128/5970_1 /TAXON_ID=938130 /ORGANISM="Platyophrya macrostoma, Strain WH" /LENGTH=206 /DNA_ID=CAMNT_0017795761 /DNA_START=89 /DNA_END=709 /DNA_ORIENTATION=+